MLSSPLLPPCSLPSSMPANTASNVSPSPPALLVMAGLFYTFAFSAWCFCAPAVRRTEVSLGSTLLRVRLARPELWRLQPSWHGVAQKEAQKKYFYAQKEAKN